MLSHAPLSGLILRTPRLTLRLPDEAGLRALAAVAGAGVHAPDQMPFLIPWTDPSPTFEADFLSYHRAAREDWTPDDWRLELGVFCGDQPIGVQALTAQRFARDRIAGSASWLGRDWQGHGYGTEMRTAILELAFSGLGARAAVTGAFADNPASARVSVKLGYAADGIRWPRVRGRAVREQRFRLAREDFDSGGHAHVAIDGLGPCQPLFGLVDHR